MHRLHAAVLLDHAPADQRPLLVDLPLDEGLRLLRAAVDVLQADEADVGLLALPLRDADRQV